MAASVDNDLEMTAQIGQFQPSDIPKRFRI